MLSPPTFLVKIVFAILGPLHYRVNFRIAMSILKNFSVFYFLGFFPYCFFPSTYFGFDLIFFSSFIDETDDNRDKSLDN